MGAMLVAVTEAEATMAQGVAPATVSLQTAASERDLAQSSTKPQGHQLGDLLARLCGVPKGALKTVLGKELGVRAWRQARRKAHSAESTVSDREIATGLLRHLSQKAADALTKNERQAKFVRLAIRYQDGRSASARTRLPGLTQDPAEILACAMQLFATFTGPPSLIHSVNLEVSAPATSAASRTPAWLVLPTPAATG